MYVKLRNTYHVSGEDLISVTNHPGRELSRVGGNFENSRNWKLSAYIY